MKSGEYGEPWKVGEGATCFVVARQGSEQAVARLDFHEWVGTRPKALRGSSFDPAKLTQELLSRRIVSAVNACAGISSEALESGVIREMMEALKDAQAQIRALCSKGDVPDSVRAVLSKPCSRSSVRGDESL